MARKPLVPHLYDKSDCHANALFDAWPRPGIRPPMAPLRHANCIEPYPLSGVTRNTFARTEFF